MASVDNYLVDSEQVRAVISSMRDRWYVVVIPTLVLGVLSLIVGLAQSPIYAATATVYVTSGNDSDVQAAYQGSLASQQRIASYAQLASSEAVVGQALNEAGSTLDVEDVVGLVHTSWDPDTVLLKITVSNRDPSQASVLANHVASALSEYVAGLETPSVGGQPMAKVTVVAPATVPESPVSPKVTRNVVLGLGLGFMVGLFAAMLSVRLSNSIRGESDVEQVSAVPVLATVPSDSSLENGPIDFSTGSSLAAESFRRLRTNLAFVGVDQELRCFAVTSSLASEGKTTTAINLCASLAETGARVVLVDADLRRPKVASRLGISSNVGLTDYLTGKARLEDVVQSAHISGLSVLAGGAAPPNPAELLGSRRAATVFEELSHAYDFVIVDTPPVLPVTDAIVTSQLVDAVLVVARVGVAKRPDLSSTLSQLSTANVPVAGVVLNDLPSRGTYYSRVYSNGTVERDPRRDFNLRDVI